ncbi:hypothetical protein M1N79_02955 [Dehalococcoidia bacterium]|nr:hypothetical protein [Dehalococcoidia bacterium]
MYERDVVLDPQRWDLPMDAVANLADRLQCFCGRLRVCLEIKTRRIGVSY